MPRRASTHVDEPGAVGRRLKAARVKAGLSQRQLSFSGCSPAYISRIEAGDRVPSLQLLREMGRRLGVSEDYLATGHEIGERFRRTRDVEAEIALRLDEIDLAERLYSQGLADAATSDERTEALTGLGQIAFRRGDHSKAIAHLAEARALLVRDGREQFGIAETLGRAYASTGDMRAATEVFEQSLREAEGQGDAIETLRFAVLLANALVDQGRFEQAESELERIAQLVSEANDPLLRARLYWSQSRILSERGDPDRGAYYARLALNILQISEHDAYTARAHQLLAFTELERGRPEEALDHLRQGWPAISATGNEVEQAQFRVEEARALASLGRYDEAKELADKLVAILREPAPEDAGRSLVVVAQASEARGEETQALKLYERAARLLTKNPNRFLVDVYERMAAILEGRGKKDEALEVLQRAVKLGR